MSFQEETAKEAREDLKVNLREVIDAWVDTLPDLISQGDGSELSIEFSVYREDYGHSYGVEQTIKVRDLSQW